jgi:hypothetical protein
MYISETECIRSVYWQIVKQPSRGYDKTNMAAPDSFSKIGKWINTDCSEWINRGAILLDISTRK